MFTNMEKRGTSAHTAQAETYISTEKRTETVDGDGPIILYLSKVYYYYYTSSEK